MKNQGVKIRKVRDFGDVLNAAFAFVKQEIKPLAKGVFLYAGIPVLVYSIFSTFFFRKTINKVLTVFTNYTQMKDFSQNISPMIFLIYLLSIVMIIFLYGFGYCYVSCYNRNDDQTPDLREVWDLFAKKFLGLLGYSLLSLVLISIASSVVVLIFSVLGAAGMVLGGILFGIAMIYVAVPLSFILVVKVNEDTDFLKAISRCFEIVKDNWWVTFGLGIITMIISWVISVVLSLPVSSYTMSKEFLSPAHNVNIDILPAILMAVLSTISTVITNPLTAIIMSFQYFNLAEKKDNNNLMSRIDNINVKAEE